MLFHDKAALRRVWKFPKKIVESAQNIDTRKHKEELLFVSQCKSAVTIVLIVSLLTHGRDHLTIVFNLKKTKYSRAAASASPKLSR